MDSVTSPPFHQTYKSLLETADDHDYNCLADAIDKCELPLIDLAPLIDGVGLEKCKEEIARTSREWGFFQVVNHGISRETLEKMSSEQIKVFKQPFERKMNCSTVGEDDGDDKRLSFSPGTYRWGSLTATCLRQLSWSEAFHIQMSDISSSVSSTTLSSTIKEFATTVADLAQKIAEILAEQLGRKTNYFQLNCLPSTCYLRLNRYPPCPIPSRVHGLIPHTDSDFITVLYQDQVGGLQLVKDGKWVSVKPIPDALIVNIGDLFQAWSNNVYKSVEHKVVTNSEVERFSIAYFFCPSQDTEIVSCCKLSVPSVYKKFSFKEFRNQVQEDVKKLGYKIGLPRFLSHPNSTTM